MSDNDRNDDRPTGSAEPTSGAGQPGGVADNTDAPHGWRPPVTDSRSDATDGAGAEQSSESAVGECGKGVS